jgi:hypothetical protein
VCACLYIRDEFGLKRLSLEKYLRLSGPMKLLSRMYNPQLQGHTPLELLLLLFLVHCVSTPKSGDKQTSQFIFHFDTGSLLMNMDMELHGVGPKVRTVTHPIAYHPVTKRRYVTLDMAMNEHEALFGVGYLHGVLSQERSMEDSPQLYLMGETEDELEEQASAVTIVCSFLQHTTTLFSLYLWTFLPLQTCRRLLNALYTNTSIKELRIHGLTYDGGGTWISELLHHNSDFINLSFFACTLRISHLVPFLRQGHQSLQTLEIKH